MSRHRLGTLALLVALAAAGCGNKTPVRPPEVIQPRAATALVASVVPAASSSPGGDRRSTAAAARMTDLGGFEIERAPGDGSGDFALVGTLELDDQMRFRPQREITWTGHDGDGGQPLPLPRDRVHPSTAIAAYPPGPSPSSTIRARPCRARASPHARLTPLGRDSKDKHRPHPAPVVPMATLSFSKLHGTANDFVYVDARARLPRRSRRARARGCATATAASAPTA